MRDKFEAVTESTLESLRAHRELTKNIEHIINIFMVSEISRIAGANGAERTEIEEVPSDFELDDLVSVSDLLEF